MSGQRSIKESLNKAYRRVRPTRGEMDLLKTGLLKMLEDANPRESEEYHKTLLRDFLKKHAFGEYFINTKGRNDLVIHNGPTARKEVAVIIETKGPGNTSEMPRTDNLNKKAVQELLLYYLRERITNRNIDIKHLIATNLNEWFIFDASEFERIAENAKLKKHFKEFEERLLVDDKTGFFYKEIASPVLEEVKDTIRFTYFSIEDYAKYLRKQTRTGDSKLIELQKVLSPTHLLKLPFANDSNTLNKEFYNELLHIIGLQEYRDKSRKLIGRKPEESRNEDSLIEAAIIQLKSLDKLTRIKDVERFGETVEEQLFNVGLELVITWINRILFLKLLESQIVGYHGSREYVFLNEAKVPEYDDLNTLFFQVLAVPRKKRRNAVREKFPNVPYLNSSLFEPTELEQETIHISNLADDTSLPLYRKTVVRSSNNTMNTLEYFLRFLDAYDFASEGKEEIAEDSKTLINASVLGLIFEKINGYKDGSFFTPGFITMYMCREVIRRCVVQKFKEETSFESNAFDDLVNFTSRAYRKAELERYNKIVNSVKICDPAVGSGHFLVSALNEMITIKAELGILCDDTGKPLRDYLIDGENDELMILDGNGDFFKYEPGNREAGRVQKTLFHEKETIIENCLFGVDINLNSVKICRLRLWIELLKNTYYKEDGELETLPNIDINIKCGNSLISRYPITCDLSNALVGSTWDIGTYRLAVMAYRNAQSKEQKREAEKLIEKIKGDFHVGITMNDPIRKKRKRIKEELNDLISQGRLFGQDEFKKDKNIVRKIEKLRKDIAVVESEIAELKEGVVYNNAFEWRFEFPEVLNEKTGEFTGFDIVIGNPPYGLFNKKQNQRVALSVRQEAIEIIKRHFPVAASGGINACRIFYNLALNLCSKSGHQSMIIPFGILTDKTSVNLRRHVFEDHCFLTIDVFPERDNARRRVFEEVKMSTAIILSCKDRRSESFNLGVSYDRRIETENRFDLHYDDVHKISPSWCTIPITGPDEYRVLAKIYSGKNLINLGSISKCLTGEADMTFAKSAMTKNSKDAVLIKGVQIDRFVVKHDPAVISQGEIEYLDVKLFQEKYKGKKLQDADRRRLVLQALTGVNERFRLKATIIDPPAFLANSCNYLLHNDTLPLNVILGLFNSKLLNFVFRCKSTSSNVNGYEVDELPIPRKIDETVQTSIDKLANKILADKKHDPEADTIELERSIDELVYELYGVSDEEIDIVKAC